MARSKLTSHFTKMVTRFGRSGLSAERAYRLAAAQSMFKPQKRRRGRKRRRR